KPRLKAERQPGTGPPEVEFVVAEHAERDVLERAKVPQLAVQSDLVNQEQVQPATQVVAERVLIQREARHTECRVRPDHAEADEGVRLNGTGQEEHHEVGPEVKHAIGAVWDIAEKMRRVDESSLE